MHLHRELKTTADYMVFVESERMWARVDDEGRMGAGCVVELPYTNFGVSRQLNDTCSIPSLFLLLAPTHGNSTGKSNYRCNMD